MRRLKVESLLAVLDADELVFEETFHLQVNKNMLDEKAKSLLAEVLEILGGTGDPAYLTSLKFDFKIEDYVFLYDTESHFNRYRLSTFKGEMYRLFNFPWTDAYRRLCRTFERDCLKSGMQERIWEGSALARRCFGEAGEGGDFSENGAPGWKLNAYNDAQYDLVSRLAGYKIIRIPMYENLMLSGSLKRIDQLLVRPGDEAQKAIVNWLKRKMQ